MEVLRELISVCRAADTTKVTERKKQIERLQELLHKSRVIKALDENTDNKATAQGKKHFNWINLFKCVESIVWKEAEYLQKAKDKTSTAFQKKKEDICSLFKNVVRLADKRGVRLNGQDVVAHIINIMKDEFTLEIFGVSHTTVLLKDILSVRKYWCELTSSEWHSLLYVYLQLLRSTRPHFDRVILARIIHTVILGATQLCDLPIRKILPILEEFFSNVKQEKSAIALEHIVSATNIICQKSSLDNRTQICRFGEKILIYLRYLWKNKPSETLKDELVEFIQLQMRAHHPCGAKTEADGAFADDWDRWKSNLRQLYEAIYNDLQELGGRNRFTTGKKDSSQIQMKENLIHLAALVCYQLFTEKSSIVEVTQSSFLQTQIGGASKKRRLESGWDVIRESLDAQTHSLLVIPWLQLLSALLVEYPTCLPEEEHASMLGVLQQSYTDSKRTEVTKWLMHCLQALANSHKSMSEKNLLSKYTAENCEILWHKVWTNTLRLISLHHVKDHGFVLLATLLKARLVSAEKDVWSLFIPGLCVSTSAALHFLLVYLTYHDLPENFKPSQMVTMESDCDVKYSLRRQLLSWMLPEREGLSEGSSWKSAQLVDPVTMATALVVLTLRDTYSVADSDICSETGSKNSSATDSESIDQVCLKTSFDLSEADLPEVVNRSTGHSDTLCSVIVNLQKTLCQLLIRDCKQLIEITEPDVKTVEAMTWMCCLFVHVANQFLCRHIYTLEEFCSSELCEMFKTLMHRMASHFVDTARKEGSLRSLDSSIVYLSQMFRSLDHDAKSGQQIAELLQALTPQKLIDQLIGIALDQSRSVLGNHSFCEDVFSQRALHKQNTTLLLDHDLDLGINGADDDLGFGQVNGTCSQSQESEGFTTANVDGCASLLSSSLLSEKEQIRLKVVRMLCNICTCCSCLSTTVSIPHSGTDLNVRHIKHRVLNLLSQEDGWDPTKPYDLQLVKVIVDAISQRHILVEQDLEVMFEALRVICKKQRKDQDICALVFSLIGRLAPHLSTSEDDMVLQSETDCQKTALGLLNIFWRLATDREYAKKQKLHTIRSSRLALARCMQAFIRVDPERLWTYWEVGGGDAEQNRTLADAFPTLLADSGHAVRLFTCDALQELFMKKTEDGTMSHSRDRQDLMFDKVYNVLQDTISYEGSTQDQEDDVTNRISCLLHALSTIACVSEVCEKKAVFAICQMVQEKNLEVQLVLKVLKKISTRLRYPTVRDYLSSHMPFLVEQWLESGYTIKHFPYRLMGYSKSTDFYRNEMDKVVPCLVMQRNEESIINIAQLLNTEVAQVLTPCLPSILSYIIPRFAQNKMTNTQTDKALQRKVTKATASYSLLIKMLTEDVVNNSIKSRLDEVVVKVLMTYHNTQETSTDPAVFYRATSPDPNPPYFTTDVITTTLDYLRGCHGASAKSLVSLLAKTTDAIQIILLSLSKQLVETRRLHEKCRILLLYRFLVQLLLREFHERLGGSWAFVLRDVIYRLLHTIQDTHIPSTMKCYERDILCLCFNLMFDVCQVALEHCPEELGRYLSAIISRLVPHVNDGGEVGTQSLKLVSFLLVENARCLHSAITLLDPLPDSPVFATASKVYSKIKYMQGPFTLLQEIRHFVQVGEHIGAALCSRLEGLRLLRQQLCNRKEELAQIVSYSQDSDPDVNFQQLILQLVGLTQSSDQAVALEASSCLGQIGPVDLSVIAVQDKQHRPSLAKALQVYQNDSAMQRYCHIFHLLDQYLISERVDIVAAASEVLKSLLSTKTGMDFCADYRTRVPDDYLFQYLHPFRCGKKKVLNLSGHDRGVDAFSRHVDDAQLWCPDHGDHEQWVTHLACQLIDSGAVTDEILRLLTPICKIQASFAQVVLPFLIHNILQHGGEDRKSILEQHITHFYEAHCGLLMQASSRTTTPMPGQGDSGDRVCTKKDSVQTMLNVIQYLRMQDKDATGRQKTTAWDRNFWLDVNYLQIAKAAQNCCAYFTALLYSELWYHVQKDQPQGENSTRRSSYSMSDTGPESQDSQLHTLSCLSAPTSINVQELMLEAYRCIGDRDGVYGCGAGRLSDISTRTKTYEHENGWNKALGVYDLELSHTSAPAIQVGLLQALQNLGTTNIMDTYLEGLSNQNVEMSRDIKEIQYEAAWRTGKWSFEAPTRLSDSCGFYEAMYSSLVAIREKDSTMAANSLKKSRLTAMNILGKTSLESVRCLYPILTKLQCATEVEQISKYLPRFRPEDLDSMIVKWSAQDQIVHNEPEFLEPILTQRCSLLRLCSEVQPSMDMKESLRQQLKTLAKFSRETGKHQAAERAILELGRLAESEKDIWCHKMEESELFWSRGERETAKYIMKTLINKLHREDDEEALLPYAQCLGTFGNWLAETRSETPSVVMDDYLNKSVLLLEKCGCEDEAALDAFLSLARYADSQFQNIANHMKSSTFEAKQALIHQAKQDAQQLRQLGDDSRYLRTLEKQRLIDEHEVQTMIEDKEKFLQVAVQYYLKCLKCGDKHDLRAFRLTSLWFDNANITSLNQQIKDSLPQLKSHKFLPLMYQLAARMDTSTYDSDAGFQAVLDNLIERAVIDHPHHTLFIILALANAHRDQELLQAKQSKKSSGRLSRTASQADQQPEEGRIVAAKKMVEKLKRSRRAAILKDMENLCLAYTQLANCNVDKYKRETKPINLPDSQLLTKLKNMKNVAVPTIDLKVDPTCEYNDIVYIKSFAPTFKLAGGINLPKIITCVASNGEERRQLVKGRDDLRQDAVMQQVFSMVNTLLCKDPETKKRNLKIRTYKVIPTSRRSGLLEWCEGTLPIGEYLVGAKDGAHIRYRPRDWKAFECRQHMNKVHGNEKSLPQTKLKAYMEACKHFQPVFRHFFFEKFLDPAQWFEKRLSYIRSVATNSIVGYILGLGDRHVQNILIDTVTAELIHIDLGVAFEQGKILPTPETVPFRLTRDIVDGMGVAGVEGVFRRCCEKTMEVMHQSHEALQTILQVLLYDPLYAWSLSPEKAIKLQQRRDPENTTELNATTADLYDVQEHCRNSNDQENVNKVAERVLLRLQQKLQGVEEGIQLSVSGQVNNLIQAARDSRNLCRLFPGWQPYI